MRGKEPMTNQESVRETQEGWAFVMQQGALLALMPIEDWLTAFERAETLGPILDPTLYRNYLYSSKGDVIKEVLAAAMVFKRAILKAQKDVASSERLRTPPTPQTGTVGLRSKGLQAAAFFCENLSSIGVRSEKEGGDAK